MGKLISQGEYSIKERKNNELYKYELGASFQRIKLA
ncbi:hypothetical protein NEOC65_001552 [Neochlamydia sp. AcF65]|nr:hypothetical protein [Neochlamydia sp. AcF65]